MSEAQAGQTPSEVGPLLSGAVEDGEPAALLARGCGEGSSAGAGQASPEEPDADLGGWGRMGEDVDAGTGRQLEGGPRAELQTRRPGSLSCRLCVFWVSTVFGKNLLNLVSEFFNWEIREKLNFFLQKFIIYIFLHL